MGIELGGVKAIPGVWSSAAAITAKTCDSCKSAAATIFCRADWCFLCLNCDSNFHTGHERVCICEVCEQAPAAVTCKADAAALCVSCDADIHSANPLARRHDRVPVEPFFDSADSIVKSSPFSFLVPTTDHNNGTTTTTNKIKTGDLFFTELDPFFDFGFQNPSQQQLQNAAMDSVVPVQTKPATTTIPVINNRNCFEIDFNRGSSKLPTFSYQTQSPLSHTVSSSSLEVGTVPDGNFQTTTDPNVPISSTSINNQATHAAGIDREARVLRYKEKRKNRKFEKTIRYASRKAYAESRPRIKGRFAKRTETNDEADLIYNSPSSFAAIMAETEYGVVPSF